MKKYSLTVPFAGAMIFEIEAESENEAIDKVLKFPVNLQIDYKDGAYIEIYDWDLYKELVRGNVCYLDYTEIEIEENE